MPRRKLLAADLSSPFPPQESRNWSSHNMHKGGWTSADRGFTKSRVGWCSTHILRSDPPPPHPGPRVYYSNQPSIHAAHDRACPSLNCKWSQHANTLLSCSISINNFWCTIVSYYFGHIEMIITSFWSCLTKSTHDWACHGLIWKWSAHVNSPLPPSFFSIRFVVIWYWHSRIHLRGKQTVSDLPTLTWIAVGNR
jgi:hypothetical protein